MKSAELGLAVQRWLDSGDSELQLLIDGALVRVQRRPAGVLCIAMLSVAFKGDDASLEAALRLSAPSLGRFSAALALDPQARRLCLMRYLAFEDVASIITALEALANQREVWEAMLERAATPSRPAYRPATLGRPYV